MPDDYSWADDHHWPEPGACDLCSRRIPVGTALCSSCALDGLTEEGDVA